MTDPQLTFVPVVGVGDVPPGTVKEVSYEGARVVIVNAGGDFFAVGSQCTHRRAPMARATVMGRRIVCPWHDGSFDLDTGAPLTPPVETPIQTYEVRVHEGQVHVAFPGVAEVAARRPERREVGR